MVFKKDPTKLKKKIQNTKYTQFTKTLKANICLNY